MWLPLAARELVAARGTMWFKGRKAAHSDIYEASSKLSASCEQSETRTIQLRDRLLHRRAHRLYLLDNGVRNDVKNSLNCKCYSMVDIDRIRWALNIRI